MFTSMFSMRAARPTFVVLILIALLLAACQSSGSSSKNDNTDVQISLQPVPEEETMTVLLTSADGTPITDATVALEGNMNHAGMIPVLAEDVTDDADGSADGHYRLPFTFTMLGDWIITVNVTLADGSSFSRNLDVRASENEIVGDAIVTAEDSAPITTVQDADHDHASHDPSDHEDVTGVHAAVIHIHDPMARPAPLAGGTGAVYFLLHNGGDTEVTLTGGESPAAGAVEIHTTKNDNGVLRMRQITEGVVLGPDESIRLEPGGTHLMLVNLVAPLAEGDEIEVTLYFEGADDFTFTVPVVGLDDLPAEDAEVHDH
jgi:periplasmic copper chaperone A